MPTFRNIYEGNRFTGGDRLLLKFNENPPLEPSYQIEWTSGADSYGYNPKSLEQLFKEHYNLYNGEDPFTSVTLPSVNPKTLQTEDWLQDDNGDILYNYYVISGMGLMIASNEHINPDSITTLSSTDQGIDQTNLVPIDFEDLDEGDTVVVHIKDSEDTILVEFTVSDEDIESRDNDGVIYLAVGDLDEDGDYSTILGKRP